MKIEAIALNILGTCYFVLLIADLSAKLAYDMSVTLMFPDLLQLVRI